jgi:Cytochrome c3
MPTIRKIGLLLLLGIPVILLISFAIGCGSHTPDAPANTKQAVSETPKAHFVGNALCKDCHTDEFNKHVHSRHANTLRPFTKTRLGELAPSVGMIPKSQYQLTLHGDSFGFGVANSESPDNPIPLAFGSGKTGMTYVAVLNASTVAEVRMSYLPHQKVWFITPGQEDAQANSLGKMRVDDKARRCISCHTVYQEGQELMPEEKFMGVGCESCHGPASLHVDAERASQKPTDHKIESLRGIGGARMNDLCGKCHRTLKEVQDTKLDKGMTQRFQPYGMALSRCFKESNDKLNCSVCHDVHTDVNTHAGSYDAACLKCHAPAGAPSPAKIMESRPCPVNPRSGCIPCHMPPKKVFQFSTLPVSMPDHYIRIHKQ